MQRVQAWLQLSLLLGIAPLSHTQLTPDCSISDEATQAYITEYTRVTDCVLLNTAPARFCQLCDSDLSNFNSFYKYNLTKECQDFSAFKTMYDSLQSLWADSSCDECSVPAMAEMQNLVLDLANCIGVNSSNTTCTACANNFALIRDYYFKQMPQSCRETQDIIDAFRRTLAMWSAPKCTKSPASQVSAQITLGGLFGIVLCFYLGVFLLGPKQPMGEPIVKSISQYTYRERTAPSVEPDPPISPERLVTPIGNRPRSRTTGSILSTSPISGSKFSYRYESFNKDELNESSMRESP